MSQILSSIGRNETALAYLVDAVYARLRTLFEHAFKREWLKLTPLRAGG